MKIRIPGELQFLFGAAFAALGFVYVATDGQIFKKDGVNPASLDSKNSPYSSSLKNNTAFTGGSSSAAKPYSAAEMAQDFSRDPQKLVSENWAKTKFDREKMTVTQYGKDSAGNEFVLELPVDDKMLSMARKNIAAGIVGFGAEPSATRGTREDIASFERTINAIEKELSDVKTRTSN